MLDYIFPYFDKTFDDYATEEDQKIILGFLWIDVIVYAALQVLVAVNIWFVIIKKEKWREILLLQFYIYAFIAINMRQVINVTFGAFKYNWFFILYDVQPNVKVNLGLIQSWMLFEIAMRLRRQNKGQPESLRFEICLKWGKWFTGIVSALNFAISLINSCIYWSNNEASDASARPINFLLIQGIMIVLMLVVDLFVLY